MPLGGTRANVIDLVAWLIVAFVGSIVVTQAIGWTGTTGVAVVQSLTPYLVMGLAPVVIYALMRRQLLVVTAACAVGFGIAVLATPLAVPDPQPQAAANSTGIRVVSINLWYQNTQIDAVADLLGTLDVDVIVFIEFVAGHQKVLETSPFASRFPHRSRPTGFGPTEMAVWSRLPLSDQRDIVSYNGGIRLDVQGPDGDVHLVVMHVPTPIKDLDAWRADLATAARIGREAEGPTLLIGDLNASYWHPDFRRLLDVGFVDAHTAAGSGFSTSWPTDRWIPPFVRLDHALTIGGLVSTGVDDLDVPGSDHRGLVVTVAPGR